MVMMQRETRHSPFLPLPTKQELDTFSKHQIGGPTVSNFRVDVGGSNRRSPWNRRCGALFAADYVKLPEAMTKVIDEVEEAFMTHISALCTQYKKLNSDKDDQDLAVILANIRPGRGRRRGASFSTIVPKPLP